MRALFGWLSVGVAGALVLSIATVWGGRPALPGAEAAEPEPIRVVHTEGSDFEKAQAFFKQAKLKEALTFTVRVLSSNPADLAALKLYAEVKMAEAAAAWNVSNYIVALDECELAGQVIHRGWETLAKAGSASSEDTSGLAGLDEKVTKQFFKYSEALIARAETLYAEGKRPWHKNDDEDKFIDALVILDAMSVELLPTTLRTRHADTWTKCYRELGKHDLKQYQLKTALVNGRAPQDR